MFIGRKTSRLFTDGLFPRLARRSDLGSSIFYKVYAPTMSKATKNLECLCNERDPEGHFRSKYHADQSATLSDSRQILATGCAIQFTKLAYICSARIGKDRPHENGCMFAGLKTKPQTSYLCNGAVSCKAAMNTAWSVLHTSFVGRHSILLSTISLSLLDRDVHPVAYSDAPQIPMPRAQTSIL